MPISRDTTAGRVFNDLRNLAHRTGRGTDELMLTYALERFLFRLSATPGLSEQFVLKGGLLLAQFGARRPTRDIDLLGRSFPNDEAAVIDQIATIAALVVDDGIVFDADTVKARAIRETEDYAGLRVTTAAHIGRARVKLQFDISFGDPITPEPRLIDYPQQLTGSTFRLLGYPLETVMAEKLTTAITLRNTNTRDRDYADLYRLIMLHTVTRDGVRTALLRTATHRGVRLIPLSEAVGTRPALRQNSYTAWLARQGQDAVSYPESFAEVVSLVCAFADPLVTDERTGTASDPNARAWL